MANVDWKRLLSEERLRHSDYGERPQDIQAVDKRNSFESDYGRIIFSPALRRMHDKTQVIPLTTDDNIHSRLTHSLEAASVANSMGVNICLRDEFKDRVGMELDQLLRTVPVILSCVALCHDIGNPPFGHFGEEVISTFFREYFEENEVCMDACEKLDFTMFDGNAQGFRVLTKLQVLQDKYGLNLAVSTLAAYLKYPFLSSDLDKVNSDHKKIGVFQSERDFIYRIRELTGLDKIRHPLALLMEAADSMCYVIMDIEDGFSRGYYRFDEIIDYLIDSGDSQSTELVNSFRKTMEKIDSNPLNQERTKMVKFRVAVFQALVKEACEEFISNLDNIDSGAYTQELIMKEERGIARTLFKFCKERIFTQREVCSLELTGEQVLKGLLGYFVSDFLNYTSRDSRNKKKAGKLYSLISNSIKTAIELETGKKALYENQEYFKLRLIVDYVTGMTDQFAVDLYQRLSGIKIG